MTKDDPSQLKHVGVSRSNLLRDHGITTIEQLHELPEKKLAEIKSIGGHYAKLIKNAVSEYYRAERKTMPAETISPKENKMQEINQDLIKKIKKLKNSLNRANEILKPLGKKKHLELYVQFKEKSSKLKDNLDRILQIKENLPKKVKKKIIKKADTLNLLLKGAGKKHKKKIYENLILEIQSFSRMLRDIIS